VTAALTVAAVHGFRLRVTTAGLFTAGAVAAALFALGCVLTIGQGARRRMRRFLLCLLAAGISSGVYVGWHDHEAHARIVSASGQMAAAKVLIFGWLGITAIATAVLFVLATLLARRAPRGLRGLRGGRRGRRAGRRARRDTEYLPPTPFGPLGGGRPWGGGEF
jgi:hypothetical protein